MSFTGYLIKWGDLVIARPNQDERIMFLVFLLIILYGIISRNFGKLYLKK